MICSETEQAAVVGQLTPDAVDQRDAPFAQTMNESRYAAPRVAPQHQRIKRGVGHAIVNHIDFFQSIHRLQIDVIVEHEQVAALHERDANSPREETVGRVNRALHPRRQQHHRRLGARGRRGGPERFHDRQRRLRKGAHRVMLENFRQHAGKRAAILHHVGEPRRAAEIVMLYHHRAATVARETRPAEMEKHLARSR